MPNNYESWGRFPKVSQHVIPLSWRHDPLPLPADDISVLVQGVGRSYGDVCLNDGGVLFSARAFNHYLDFDATCGRLRCEAGVTLADILAFSVPRGWFLSITPGTKFVTIGGAIANDVHGKNHHRAGTFGNHLLQFELLRSNGERLLCSPDSNAELFAATIGGLGLTGLITWAEIQLKPIVHRAIQADTIQFYDLEEFFTLSAESDAPYEYTMAWVDCNSRGKAFGRGIFFRGNHIPAEARPPRWRVATRHLTMPLDLPGFALNRHSVAAFNFLYYHQQHQKIVSKLVDYNPFFYPLDAVLRWNRLYGKQGFLQYQCVVPDTDHQIITAILRKITDSGMGSFLAVLKTFGNIRSPGMLSFPRAGVTLALDFPIKGAQTFKLLEYLDDMVVAAGGRVYPCKDARLSPQNFKLYYPQWEQFAQHIDPRFSSSFWRRVTR
jgi:FAD/FMN-containing dehydrogenase